MDRFLNEQNIERYRKLADTATDEAQRVMIMRLLAEENAKLKASYLFPRVVGVPPTPIKSKCQAVNS